MSTKELRSTPPARSRAALVLVFVLLCLPELALLGFFTAGAVLSFSAELPRQADVVVVLGGGENDRFERGRDLIFAGYSEHLVLIAPTITERKAALSSVPDVIFWDDVNPPSSWGEAQATRLRMQVNGWDSVLVVSDPPHMLRLRYVWGSIFRDTNLTYTLIASNPAWWSTWLWWRDRHASEFVKWEVVKFIYYIVHYRFNLDQANTFGYR